MVLVVSVAVYAISFLLTMALSRYRELAADRSGALLTGQALGAGLGAGEGDRRDVEDPAPGTSARRRASMPSTSHRPSPRAAVSLSTLFSTHPPLEKRLAQLASIEAELGRPS